MKSSLLLGNIFNIKIYVHWTFLFLLAYVLLIGSDEGLNFDQGILRISFIFALFACVVLHELGHALTARKFGCQTRRIVLLPIGGMAQIEKIPKDPKQELIVAIAGPIVSFSIAALLYLIIDIGGEFPSSDQIKNMNIDDFISQYFLFYLCLLNFMLAIFNLIPAFPMDGGRILRAFLAMNMSRLKATKISVVIGQFLAILFVVMAININNPWLAIIGIFIFLAAKGEAMHEDIKSLLSKFKVKDLTMRQYTALDFNDPIQKAVDLTLNGQEKEFIFVNGKTTIGVLTRDDIIKALSKENSSISLHQAMNENFLELNPNMELSAAYEQMILKRFSVAAVIENNELIGILDIENIQEFMLFRNAFKK
jgi:Zn-dependent protease/CBS domain-containing protein